MLIVLPRSNILYILKTSDTQWFRTWFILSICLAMDSINHYILTGFVSSSDVFKNHLGSLVTWPLLWCLAPLLSFSLAAFFLLYTPHSHLQSVPAQLSPFVITAAFKPSCKWFPALQLCYLTAPRLQPQLNRLLDIIVCLPHGSFQLKTSKNSQNWVTTFLHRAAYYF